MSLEIKILNFDSEDIAESGTTSTNITMTAHGLSVGDYIVNQTRSTISDRGSRKVTAVVDQNNVTVDSVSGQVSGDTILKFAFVDRTSLLKAKTLRIIPRAEDESSCSFSISTDSSYFPRTGQEIIIDNDGVRKFGGIITSARRRGYDERMSGIVVDISADGYSNIICRRRTVSPDHENMTAGQIMTHWAENILNQEGVSVGRIDDGCDFAEFKSSVMSLKSIFNKCAQNSGYKWFIDKSKALQFFQDDAVITDSANNLVDGNGFGDFRNVQFEESLTDYINKQFVVGGLNDYGFRILINQEDATESAAQQAIEAGSGVYGDVYEDNSVENATYNTSEAGTTTTNINVSNHGLVVGDYVYNFTTGSGRNVTAVVDANNVTVDEISDMVAGDEIIIYTDANAIIRNTLKKQGIMPAELHFNSGTEFIAGTRLRVDLAELGLDDSYYLIDRVEIYDSDGINLRYQVKSIARKTAEFSTQKKEGFKEFFEKIVEKGGSDVFNITSEGIDIFFQEEEPTEAKEQDKWMNPSDYSRYDYVVIDSSVTLEIEDGEVNFCTGTITISLFSAADQGGVVAIFKNVGTGVITIDPQGSETIDGALTYTLSSQYDKVTIISDGSNWMVI